MEALPTLAGEAPAVLAGSLQGTRPPSAPAVSCASCAALGEGVRKNKQEEGSALFRIDWPHGQCYQLAYQETVVEVSNGCYESTPVPSTSTWLAARGPPLRSRGDTLPDSE